MRDVTDQRDLLYERGVVMEAAGEYILSVTATALICAVSGKLLVKGTAAHVVKLMTGILMALTMVSPLLSIRLDQVMDLVDDIHISADYVAHEGENSARQEMAQRISKQLESYILDKAESMGVELVVTFELESKGLPVPCAVTLQGNIGPYAKAVLTDYIEQNLGIEAEAQIWTG